MNANTIPTSHLNCRDAFRSIASIRPASSSRNLSTFWSKRQI